MRQPGSVKMRYFPVYADMLNALVLVIGKNQSAIQKVRLLLKTRAQILVFCGRNYDRTNGAFAREFAAQLYPQTNKDNAGAVIRFVSLEEMALMSPDELRLIYHAPDDNDFSEAETLFTHRFLQQARRQNAMINVIDAPEDCTFITPAIVDRTPLTVAIGTEGIAPTLAQKVKTHLETWLPKKLGDYLQQAKCLRPGILQALPQSTDRRQFWRAFFSDEFTRLFFRDKKLHHQQTQKLFQEIHQQNLSAESPAGAAGEQTGSHTSSLVSFVGAGPGDPELMTLKAVQKLQQADVIIYDRLIDDGVLEYARRDALRINVGKKPGEHSVTQPEINKLLQDYAQKYRFVVRLKGGDPLIFGRISEEIGALNEIGAQYEIVPGITAAFGCAASAGITLTHRDKHHGLHIISGHSKTGMPEYHWESLARLDTPLVIYMGVKYSGAIRQKLIDAGIDQNTDVTVIENGLRPNEKIIVSDIRHFCEEIEKQQVHGPAIIYIGLKPAGNPSHEKLRETFHHLPEPDDNAGEFACHVYQVSGKIQGEIKDKPADSQNNDEANRKIAKVSGK